MFNIYTSGAIKGLTYKDNEEWRVNIYNWFSFMNTEQKTKIFIPQNHFNYDKTYEPITEKGIKEYFLHKVRNSDLIIVNLEHSARSVGTAIELCEASHNNIPIIGYAKNTTDVSEWCELYCHVIFDDWEELLLYVLEYYVNN